MDAAFLRHPCSSLPARPHSSTSISPSSLLRIPWRPGPASRRSRPRRGSCTASGPEILVAEASRGDLAVDAGDLRNWLEREGLPPCKVVLKEGQSNGGGTHRPIHYIAASEDLQAGDVAFSVPDSLVVTLERVLGNETIGKELVHRVVSHFTSNCIVLLSP